MRPVRFGPLLLALALFAATNVCINYYVDHAGLGHVFWQGKNNPDSLVLQKEAFDSPGYLPMYGSSEFGYLSEKTHPAHMFGTSNAGFRPFIAAAAGNEDLIQVQNLSSLGTLPAGKKAVFVLSMQWFSPGGISNNAFERWFSPLKAYRMVFNPGIPDELKQKIAARLMQFKTVKDNGLLYMTLKSTKSPHSAGYAAVRLAARCQMAVLSEMDYWYAWQTLRQGAGQAPPRLYSKGLTPGDWARYLHQAEADSASSSNNRFGMNNNIYQKRYKRVVSTRENSKAKNSNAKKKAGPRMWFDSREYSDLQLLLDTLRGEKVDALFIIQAANGYWYDYTGLPRGDRLASYEKCSKMIKAAGFKVADFSNHEYDKGFLVDASHPSVKGWCYMDEAIYRFYKGTME